MRAPKNRIPINLKSLPRAKREVFRQLSYPGMYCEKSIKGHGFAGYREAIQYLAEKYGK